MTTIRRTLSPVPRPGTILGGEAVSVASPLSKCTSCSQDYTHTPTNGSVSNPSFGTTEYMLYRFQTFVLNLFSKRTSRSLERQKPKGNTWRRSLFHFLLCFLVGVFVGFTPIVSITTSTDIMSRNQAFSFDQVEKVQLSDFNDMMSTNHTKIEDTLVVNNVSFNSDQHVTDVNQENKTMNGNEMGFGKFLIIVTPTYPRMFQGYYLNRLAQTLKLVEPPLLWVVVEMTSQSGETSELLRKSGVMYRHLVCTKNTTEIKDSRVHQRNVALSHIEKHQLDGIVYFADDTNIYSTELFEHMRQIRRFGTWPVAKLKASTRVATFVGPVCNGIQVIGWHTNNVMRRFHRFHADLAGFAFNSTILWDPVKWHRLNPQPIRHLDNVKDGFQVSTFIEQVVEDEAQMEGITDDCSKVLVWHLPIESSSAYPQQSSLEAKLDAVLPISVLS
ncbi:probable beta-1,4-xylosyltransferase IRX9H [Rutidosis leptorrhynchoides]|uniref:probable beta-1,4-xylosyltransferase IRX9H n=1 Tax=Rutidosis leptorrhynchoides TaxID=125765 RepID=UPI003A990FAB